MGGLWGFTVTRNWLLASIAVGVLAGVLFAAFPSWDLQIAGLFFDPSKAKFPLSVDYSLNIIRRSTGSPTFCSLLPVFALLRKLIFPASPMLMAPSVGSFLLGPGLTSNLLLKENWGRPRPNFVQQFAGTETFQPWWHPSSACKRNCSFVSGEASQAHWTVAPASLAPPQLRPLALGSAVVFGTTVGAMRVVFGRHFVTDIIFAGVITIAIVVRVIHRSLGTLLAGAGWALAKAGAGLRQAGRYLHKRVACL